MPYLPELLLVLLALLILGLDLILPSKRRSALGWVTALGTGAILGSALIGGGPAGSAAVLRADPLSFFFRALLLLGAMLAALLSVDSAGVGRRGEYYALMVFSTAGLCLMASASDLVMLALAVEMAALPAYLLAGFLKRDSRSTEAGLKYFLFGATASAVMWYGFSLVYGFTGQTDLSAAAAALNAANLPTMMTALLPILAGLAFKTAAVPFHFWAPDVYEGGPTPVSAFLSTAVKAAGFAVLMRLLLAVFPPASASYWGSLLAVMAAATMTLGNLLAMVQKNVKRLLAYSSIAHAGYALIGLVTLNPDGLAATAFYLLTYTLANLAAFSLAVLVSNATGSDDLASWAGLGRRSPGIALAALAVFLSLAGMPPLAGFGAKLFLVASAVEAGLPALAVVAVLNSVLGLYYYLAVLKVVFLYRSELEPAESPGAEARFPVPPALRLALGIGVAGILILGVAAAPWFEQALRAVRVLFPG
jgi:NADH-quinone oxidoreductase subunit N